MKLKRVMGVAFVAFLNVALGMLAKMEVRKKETNGGRRLLLRTRMVTRSRPGTEQNMWRCAADFGKQ